MTLDLGYLKDSYKEGRLDYVGATVSSARWESVFLYIWSCDLGNMDIHLSHPILLWDTVTQKKRFPEKHN